MKRFVLIVFFFILAWPCSAPTQQDFLRLMRYPDIAFGKIVFSYQGDLWVVPQEGGRAARLTVHDGFESNPKFSPDGKWIAFTGNDFGGTNVFIIPFDGGEPKQLTFEPSPATVVGWTPDSQHVLFSANRTAYSGFFTELFKVSIDGRFPEKLPVDRGSLASYSPDGRQMVYVRHPITYWWWKRYKGTLNHDLWVYDFEKAAFQQITAYPGHDTWPMWGKDGKVYFVTDRDGTANLFTYELSTGSIRQVTKHPHGGVQWPAMSPDGRWIVYENEGRLWRLNTETGITGEVFVRAPTDDRFSRVAFVNPGKFVQGWDVSPHAKRIVLDTRGKLFSVPVKHGDTRRVTQAIKGREQFPAWSPDGKWIAYVSDENGEQEIYLADQMGQGEPRRLTQSGKFKLGLSWSPDSKKLLFHTNDQSLCLVEVESQEMVRVARNPVTLIDDYSWSPDSRWVAYTYRERNFNGDLHLYDVEQKRSVAVLTGSHDEYQPVFTPDGKTLVFLSEPIPDQVEIHSASLIPEEKAPYQMTEDEEGAGRDPPKNEGKEPVKEAGREGDKKKDVSSSPSKMKIEWEGLRNRVRRVPLRQDLYKGLQATDSHYYFLMPMPKAGPEENPGRGGMSLYAFDLKDFVSRKVADHVLSYRIAAKEKRLVFWDGEGFRVLDASGKEGKPETVSLANLRLKVDRMTEWEQIFDESWRMLRDYFYDPDLHGVDWAGRKRHYQSLLPFVRTRQELNLLLNEMVGEINASHQGVYGGDIPNPVERYPLALLGADLAPDPESGFYRFKKIYRGVPSERRFYAPLHADYVKIQEGDYLLAIDGQRISGAENYLRYLVNQDQKHIELTTNSRPVLEGARITRIKPISNDYSLRYLSWVEKNREKVEKTSAGKIGYFHLEAMGEKDFKEFKKWFEAYRYREAIIMDVRYNGGGYIDPKLIDLLERRPYQVFRNRDSVPLERPLDGFYGKVVVLCNEYSFSDAEVFSSAFKARKLGQVIGKQTLGYVIATRSHSLIDGGTIRQPFVGMWELDGTLLEGFGAVPDRIVENTPNDEVEGKDPQLEKAIEVLMTEIEKDPRSYDYRVPIQPR